MFGSEFDFEVPEDAFEPELTIEALATVPRWVAWREEWRNEKPTKVPYSPRGSKAQANNPRTWGTRDAAAEAARKGGMAGTGIMLGQAAVEDGLALGGIDLDSCRDPETGALAPWAEEVIGRLGTYAEVSPSGTGAKAFFSYAATDLPALRAEMRSDWGRQWKRAGTEHPPAIELYLGNRYFTVTEQAMPIAPAWLRTLGMEDLLWLIREAGPAFAPAPSAAAPRSRRRTTDEDEIAAFNEAMRENAPIRGQDRSRSGAAFRVAAAAKAAGADYEGMKAALLADPETAEWTRDKGLAAGERELRRLWERADKRRPDKAEKGPLIRLAGGRLHHEATAGETALLTAGRPIYQRGASLVRPAVHLVPASRGRTTHSACLIEVSAHGLIDNLCAVANWERFDGRSEEWVEVNPPMAVAQTILSRAGEWKFSRIAGVITTPTLRPDGSILSEPGYDAATRLYHMADPDLHLHPAVHRPSRADAEKALALLQGLLAEFPCVDDVAKAVALSGMLTPVVRGALSVVPLHAFKAYTAGTGKSYLADVCSAIATGRPCPVAAAAPDEAETEKRIAGLLLAGYPIASLDNCNGELGGDLLCQAIERPLIRIRPLGRSDIIEIESRATLFATGNALRVRGDMTRRTVVCSLDAGVERPELREFSGDPVAMVMQDRGRYVSACLIIVRAYAAAGCPGVLKPIASFEDWSGAVRSALVWLGCADPAASMEAAREDDPELAELREVVSLWREALGTAESHTARDVASLVQDRMPTQHGEPTDYRHPDFRDALLRLVGERGEINTKRFGKWLMNREGRIVDGHRIKRDTTGGHGGSVRWRVQAADHAKG